MKMKAISKEMRKRQRHFPWLKSCMKEFFKTYPNCKKTLQYLVENIENEVKELRKGHKQKTKVLFETINDLYLHFWWKIHWKQSSQWKNYWNVDTTHSYRFSELIKCFGKLLSFLVYLGIILSQGATNSLWINRVLQAINILPANDEIVYDALLQLHVLKKKYKKSYMEILRHILCSEIILNISEPTAYVKSLMLFRRLKNFMEDEVAKASLISTASRIKPPSNLTSWLSSLEISVDVNKSIIDQLFEKKSKRVFLKLYHALIDFENSGSNNKEKNSISEKKSDNNESVNEKEEEKLLRVAVGFIDTPNKDINCTIEPSEKININGKNNQIKKVLHLPELCKKIKNSRKKKKHNATNKNINLVNTESNTKSNLQLMDAKTGNLIKSSLDSQNSSTKPRKSKKKKKPKAKKGIINDTGTSKNNDTKSKETSKNKTSGSKSKKSKKKKKSKEINNSSNVIPDNKKSDLLNLETHSNEARSSNNDDSILVNSKFHTEGSSQAFKDVNDSTLSENNLMINEEEKSKVDENSAIKKVKLSHSGAENKIFQTDSNDKISNENDISCKLPNLLANYEMYSSAEENETAKRDASSCPLVESGDNVLVPDTCRNDFNSIVPFNLDSWIPSKDDTSRGTSVSNDGSLSSDKYSYSSLTDIKRTKKYQNNQSDNSSFSDSAFEYINDSEASQDTLISNDGSQISDKYPYVSLTDIRKNKKWSLYQNSDYSNSSFDDSVVGNVNDSDVTQDTCISYESQISDKNPYVSLVDIKKMKNANLHQMSDCSNSSYDSSYIGNINCSEISQDTCISNEKSQISGRDANDIKKVDKIAHHQNGSNYDSILGNVSSNEAFDVSNQNPDNTTCDDLSIPENRNDKISNTQGENRHGGNVNKGSESPIDETLVQSKQFQENQSPCEKHSKAKINSPTKRQRKQTNYNASKKLEKRKYSSDNNGVLVQEGKHCRELETSANDVNGDVFLNDLSTLLPNHGDIETQENATISPLKAKINSPTKRQRKQTNYNARKKQKRKFSSDNNEDLVQLEEGKSCQELETSANDVNGDVFLNDLSTLLPNHGDIETQENATISPSINIALNHSDTQDLSEIQEHNTLLEESNILPHELNGKQSASHTSLANSEEQPCVTLPNENPQNDVPTCSIETVIEEFIESELSKVHGSCNNLDSVRLSDNVTEKTHAGSVQSVGKNAYSPSQTRSDLAPSDCFNYKSNLNSQQQNNNQSNTLFVPSSSTTENKFVENEVARSLLNLSVNENSPRIALSTNPDHRKENTNMVNANFNSGNSTFVVDCNIINDFDSRNSSRAGSSVSGDTTTIKLVLNIINAKPENSSSPQNPNSSGNGFLTAYNSSQGQHSSVASGQVMNNSNFSFPVHRNNSYFSEPPFFIRRTAHEFDTPPDSESHLKIPSLPTVKNMVSSCSDDKTNFLSSSKSKGRSSTPKNLSKKRQRSAISHSSESANEWHLDLNSSFSNIPSLQSMHPEDVLNTSNVHQKGNNNHSAKRYQDKKSISEIVENSTSTCEKTSFQNPRQIVPYRNSRPSIYSDESEDELSVSTMSLLSGEETDHSLIKPTDDEISPKSPLHRENNSSRNKKKLCHEERWGLNTLTGRSLIKSNDNKILPKTPPPRKNNTATNKQTKKLFREEKWALDSLTPGSSVEKKSTVAVQKTQKKRRQKKVVKTAKKPKISIKHDYNLRLRPSLTPPTKLKSYFVT